MFLNGKFFNWKKKIQSSGWDIDNKVQSRSENMKYEIVVCGVGVWGCEGVMTTLSCEKSKFTIKVWVINFSAANNKLSYFGKQNYRWW